jgi:hypothetical protein
MVYEVCAYGFYELMCNRRIFCILEVIGPFAVPCQQTLKKTKIVFGMEAVFEV